MKRAGLLLLCALWLAVLGSSLAVVHSTQRSRELTAQLGAAQKMRDQLRTEQERLLLEKGAWSAYSRIEKVARTKLNMHVPAPEERVMVTGQ
ncbi:cell division protein FtsL [Microbulbifer sp. 2201CG32-9]|uniref:cell division protein FtsL n=1 Tax=unclassified Microbulbifer TaxID=2619833 RepID=UPI00345BDE6A